MIRIDGEMEDSDCILRITDNGRGMTPERLEQVRRASAIEMPVRRKSTDFIM